MTRTTLVEVKSTKTYTFEELNIGDWFIHGSVDGLHHKFAANAAIRVATGEMMPQVYTPTPNLRVFPIANVSITYTMLR